MPKKILFLLLFLVGFTLGLPVGFMQGRQEYIRMEDTLGRRGEEDMVDTFGMMQYTYADSQNARRALLDAIAIHEKMQADDPDWDKIEQERWGFCYGHLALLEESAGNSDLSRSYMVKAKQILTHLGYSEDVIQEILQKHSSVRAQAGGMRP